MQITLIQSEIEQALKNYINDIMSVKDGMEIEIQLKAPVAKKAPLPSSTSFRRSRKLLVVVVPPVKYRPRQNR